MNRRQVSQLTVTLTFLAEWDICIACAHSQYWQSQWREWILPSLSIAHQRRKSAYFPLLSNRVSLFLRKGEDWHWMYLVCRFFLLFRSSSLAYWSKYQDKIRIGYNKSIKWKVKKDDMPWQGKMTHVIEAVIADYRKPPSFYETKLLLWAQVRKWVMWLWSRIKICTAVKTQSRCAFSPPGWTTGM